MTETTDSTTEFDALRAVISALQRVEPDARARIFDAAATFLQLDRRQAAPQRVAGEHLSPVPAPIGQSQQANYPGFSEDTSPGPKEFLFQKQPRTDVERIAALAFYLTHYRDTPYFKTLDLTKLNTEAAQPKFSNAANSANNAVKQGYLVSATKGQRQVSAAGERFVAALPDREAARAAMNAGAPRRRTRKPATPRAKPTAA